MYLKHYDLKKKPFGLSPGPDFFWLSEKHKEALATLRYGVIGDLGFLLLTGEVGVGKTALIHRLLSSLDASTIVAHITDPDLGVNDFFRLLAVEFGIDAPFTSKGDFLIILEQFLLQADKDQKKVLLIVDEAQRVNNVLLDQIRVLSNIELGDRKLINIFFIGQPEFKTTLLDSANRAIRQRIAIYYHVQPFTEEETGQYIAHRLEIAGASQNIFKPGAVREIFRISNGYPRAINILCDHALLSGFATGVQAINNKIIRECENELNIEAEIDIPSLVPASSPEIAAPTPKVESKPAPPPPLSQRSRAWTYPAVILAGIIMVTLAGYYFLWSGPNETLLPQQAAGPAINPAPQPVPALSKPDNGLAQSESSQQDAGGRNQGQADPEPPAVDPQAEVLEAIQKIAVPTPPPEFTIETASFMEKNQGAENLPAGEATPSDREGTPPLLAAIGSQEKLSDNHSLPKAAAVSPGAMEAPAAVEQAATETNPILPGDEPAGPSIQQPQAPASQPLAANQTPPTPPAENPATDGPPTGSEASPNVPAPATRQPEDQIAPPVSDSPDNAAEAEPPPVPANVPLATLPGKKQPPATGSAPTPPKANAKSSAASPAAAGPPASAVATAPVAGQKIGDLAPAAAKTNAPSQPVAEAPAGKEVTASQQAQPKGTDAEPNKADLPQAATKSSPPGELPAVPAEPAIPAMAALQPPSNDSGAAESKAPGKKDLLENRIEAFLQSYCSTYSSKDLDSFSRFFASDAVENGKPFDSLIPKYKKNFTFIETIYYRIELRQVAPESDGEMVTIDGDFFLRWLPPDKKWRENAGKINMTLEDNGSSFLVHRLDYQSNRAKKN